MVPLGLFRRESAAGVQRWRTGVLLGLGWRAMAASVRHMRVFHRQGVKLPALVVVVLTLAFGCSPAAPVQPVAGSATSLYTDPATDQTTTTTIPAKMRRPLLGDITIETHRTRMLDTPDEVGTCTTIDGGFIWAEQEYFDFAAIPASCRPGKTSSENGRFGLYRSAADAADLREVLPAADTPIGSAELFVVDYMECTSFCDVIPTPVAVIILDRPLVVDGIEYDLLNLYETNTDGEPQAMYKALANLRR